MIDMEMDENCAHERDLGSLPREFSESYFLTPAECTPEQRLPLTVLINRIIEVATLHANILGIGYENLLPYHQTWVLSRVALEMSRYPQVNDTYTVGTWINSINRLFSERDFEITDGSGDVIGHARTLWAVLDTRTRAAGDISRMAWCSALIPDRECPIAKASRPQTVTAEKAREGGGIVAEYSFKYTDLDFNRHVNSSRYIELLLNQWDLAFHDANRLTRFEIAYMHEAVFGQEAQVRILPETIAEVAIDTPETQPMSVRAEIACGDQTICRALLRFSPR